MYTTLIRLLCYIYLFRVFIRLAAISAADHWLPNNITRNGNVLELLIRERIESAFVLTNPRYDMTRPERRILSWTSESER